MANTRAQKTAQNLSTLTTAGDIAYATAAGTPARLGIGSSAQVLTVASGVPSWATPASGALTLITRQTFTNVATTTTTFDGIFTSTYKEYIVVFENMYAATSSDTLQFQLRAAGVTKTVSYYTSVLQVPGASTTLTNLGGNNTTSQALVADAATSGRFTGQMAFHDMLNTQIASWTGLGIQSAQPRMVWIAGMQNDLANYDGILFKSSSSNVTGTVSVYGMAKI